MLDLDTFRKVLILYYLGGDYPYFSWFNIFDFIVVMDSSLEEIILVFLGSEKLENKRGF